MTQIQTARVREVLGLSVGLVKEAAHRLDANSDLQQLEADLAELERAIGELKSNLAGLPYKHTQ